MKHLVKALNASLPDLTADLNRVLSERLGTNNLRIAGMDLSSDEDCPAGYERVCRYFGNDPVTGKPVIRCRCVKRRPQKEK